MIDEHEVLELETPAPGQQGALQSPAGEEFPELSSAPIFSIDLESSAFLAGGDMGTDRSYSPLGTRSELDGIDSDFVTIRPPHVSDSALTKNYTEPGRLSSVFRTVSFSQH